MYIYIYAVKLIEWIKTEEKLKNKIIIINIQLDVFLSLCFTGRIFGSFYLRLNANSNCHCVYMYAHYNAIRVLLKLFGVVVVSAAAFLSKLAFSLSLAPSEWSRVKQRRKKKTLETCECV